MDIFKVCRLGFGTSQIGGPALINGKMTGAKPIPKRVAVDILRCAYDNGINFFDTSDKYGNAEELLGEAFSEIRNKVVIATKCGLVHDERRDFSIPYINACMENSLRRMRTDYIDIFQLAKPDAGQITDGLLSFFEKRIRDGKIRYFGISIIGKENEDAYLSKKIITSLQVFYNLLFTESHEFIDRCGQANKFVIVRSPLNSGILSGRYTMDTRFDKVDTRSAIFHGRLLKERLECVEKLKGRFDLSPDGVLAFSLNFIISNDNVDVVIPAASKVEQLEDYINIFNKKNRFDEIEIKEIMDFVRNEVYASMAPKVYP